MEILIFSTQDEASEWAASMVVPLFLTQRLVRLGLATGNTMIPVYHAVIQQLGAIKGPMTRHVETFNLDEYWPIAPEHPGSFSAFMHQYLFSQITPYLHQVHFLQGNTRDPDTECQRFEALLNAQPLDCQLLGLGVNGHIGFNEPGTSFASRTRKVRLSRSTIHRNSRQFPGVVPSEALTMGIANIMEAKQILLMAWGPEKRAVLTRAVRGPVGEDCPASVLQTHPNVMVITDAEAGKHLLTADPFTA
ncbi:glucosamine-6-phosphate deaminase [Sulfobacillus thermosulfidooxidans]|uniref:glucosamine-6-phosphate deaminase n=1 Tax=Sulfobacillus thermosulfidooxidans TaxID=28034 RepID=UPI0006B49BA0|nr:glucosamine-6-phosphate deaminase [Sulfobacillus thermosulfidooxidans]